MQKKIDEKQLAVEILGKNHDAIKNLERAANKIIGSGMIALLSLFFPWVSIKFRDSVFGINTPIFLVLLLWWYSSRAAFSKKRISPLIATFLAVLSVFFGVAATLLSTKIPLASPGFGIVVYLIAACVHFEAVRKYTKHQSNTQYLFAKEMK